MVLNYLNIQEIGIVEAEGQGNETFVRIRVEIIRFIEYNILRIYLTSKW